jgi:hypothetical protein
MDRIMKQMHYCCADTRTNLMANLCSLPMDGSLLHVYEGCEVLCKLHSPFPVTEEVGDEGCHCKTIQNEPHAAIGWGVKKWHLDKLMLVLCSTLRSAVHYYTCFLRERHQYPSKVRVRAWVPACKTETCNGSHTFPIIHTHNSYL